MSAGRCGAPLCGISQKCAFGPLVNRRWIVTPKTRSSRRTRPVTRANTPVASIRARSPWCSAARRKARRVAALAPNRSPTDAADAKRR